jgi:hypothetical protein
MATSGSVDFTLNRNQIITAALRKLRAVDPNDTAGANDITTGAQALNLMIKAWQLDGFSMHLNQEVVLHLGVDSQSYTLGPSGSHCALLSDAGYTQLAADEPITETSIEVDSITGIASADITGIVLDSGAMDWDVVNGAPAGTTVTITTGLAGAAATDQYLFHYTTKIGRPVEILEARIRDTDDNDTPLNIVTSLEEFMAITDKTSSGRCTDIHLVPTITNSTLYTWPVASDVTDRIVMTVRRVIEDFDASTDNADAPVEMLDCLIWNLAKWLMPEYTKEPNAMVIGMAEVSFDIAKRFFTNKDPIYVSPA